MDLNLTLLKEICEAPGVSGFENRIRKLIESQIKDFADEISVDNIGNLLALKKGTKTNTKKVMVAAHMDEIGFMVNHIDENGFIRFFPLGGFDPKTLTSQRVVVHGKKDLLGVMGCKPIHLMNEAEKKKTLTIDDFFIDVGLDKKEIEKIIPLGSPVTRQRELAELGNCITCKSLDNRISVYILIEVLKQLKKVPYDVYAVFTVQEEVGLRGAKVAAQNIVPDFGIALDTGVANDIPSNKGYDRYGKLHAGTGIKKLDRSVICDSRMVNYLENLAIKYKIPYQHDIKLAGGTDTASLQLNGRSIAGAISTVTRYLHQTTETLSKSDVKSSISLLKVALEEMDQFDWDKY
ncbi:MAG: M42 family metallopeptidase [Bacteroidetes bacterium]|nr:M42 family metallopeptidase [Bacteroidota bacterium]